jgi:hypothetical protein
LFFSIDEKSINRAVDFIQKVNGDLRDEAENKQTYEFHSFIAKNHQNILASIDGSHQTLKGKSFVFSAINSGFLLFQANELVHTEVSRTKIEILTKDNYKKRHAEYYINVTGQRPQGDLDYDKSTERIRTLLEWDKVKYLISMLNSGDIILFDGSMISGVISTNKQFFDSLCETAKSKGIILAGLSKDTSLLKDNIPVPLLLAEQARNQNIIDNWYSYYEPEKTYFVKFRKMIDLVFRLDLVLPDNLTAADVIPLIASYCYDRGNPAYPYPLLMIHDSVRISDQQFHICLETFKDECRLRKIPLNFVGELFSIYHDQLDTMSHGR